MPKWFHTYNEHGEMEWQGVIYLRTKDAYFVQLFEWAAGEPSVHKWVAISATIRWRFYRTHAKWIEASNQYFDAVEKKEKFLADLERIQRGEDHA